LKGKHVTLAPLAVEHVEALYGNVGGDERGSLYKVVIYFLNRPSYSSLSIDMRDEKPNNRMSHKELARLNRLQYMSNGPFTDVDTFKKNIESMVSFDSGLSAFVILGHGPLADEAVGIITYLNINPTHRTIEIGHVLFSPKLQRTTASTEAPYLMMKHAFEELHFLRVEWKCNNFNGPSKSAALRLGFLYEGLSRKHMIVKGISRDTWWGSVVDEEWFEKPEGSCKSVKAALEEWLEDDNFDNDGQQKRRLEDIRKGE
jgi:RimJ/RimL family protein N-acetyltransferase